MHRVVPNLDDLTFVPVHALARAPRGVPREVRDADGAGDALRGEPRRAGPADHDRRHVVRRAVGSSQDGARHRREARGHLHHHRRRRHVPRGARGRRHHGLPGAPVPVRVQPRPHEDGAGHRDRGRPGGQAGDRRRPAGIEGLRGDRRAADAARRRRPAFAGPASGLHRTRRPAAQDRGDPRGDRLAGSHLREDGGVARLRRREARGEGRRRRPGDRRDGRRDGSLAGRAPRPHRRPDVVCPV